MKKDKVNSHKFHNLVQAHNQGYCMEGDTIGDSHVDMRGVRYELDKSLDDDIENYMKISDLISELQTLQAVHGDVLVAIRDNEGQKSLIGKDNPFIECREEELTTDHAGYLTLKWFPDPKKVNVNVVVMS